MPRTCNIEGCKKTAKLMSDNTKPVVYLCNLNDEAHNQRRDGLTFKKLVNSPCITCVSSNQQDVKEATFGPIVQGKLKRMYCKAHSDTNASVVGKQIKIRQCEHAGCETQPSYCVPGETVRRFCKKHKPNNSIHAKIALGNTCKHEFEDQTRCMIQCTYGFVDDERPRYCREHSLQGMRNIVDHGRGCEIKNCTIIRATFGHPHDKKPSRFAAHRTHGMIDIVNPKCVGCGLYVVTAQKKFKCSYCSEEPCHQKQKESTVFSILEENFADYPFSWNCAFPQDTSCALAKYRPDFAFNRGTYYHIVECDEDAHRQYDETCERKRMYEIAGGLGLPVVFVRYNPDSFTINGTVSQCHHTTKKKHLVSTVQKYLTTSVTFTRSTIIVHYLFYDTMKDSYERVIGLEEIDGDVREIEL